MKGANEMKSTRVKRRNKPNVSYFTGEETEAQKTQMTCPEATLECVGAKTIDLLTHTTTLFLLSLHCLSILKI